MEEPKIAAAVASFTTHGTLGKSALSKRLEAAMVAAVEQALAEGVSIEDGEEMRRRQEAARQAVLADDAE